jgi:hypothetical protein
MRAGWACTALLACGCATIPHRVLSRLPEPSATVTSIRVGSFERQRAALVVVVDVESPTAELSLTESTYEVLLQQRPFAAGALGTAAVVPPGRRVTVELPVQLAFLDVPWPARERLKAGAPLQLVVRGVLRGTRRDGERQAAAEVEFDGETEVQPTDAALP